MLQIDFISNCEKWKIEINNHDKITSVIHPGKGGYEIIQYLDKSSWFAPVWLIIVNSIVDTIIENKTTDTRFSNWLNWIDKPHSISVIKLDMKSFISDRTKVVKDSIQTDFYKHNELIDNRLFIGSSERFSFEIPATYDISCLDLLIAGFYLAEGTSSKDDIANLGSQTVPHNKFAIGFNQTEERLISAMIKWLQDLKIKVPWGVKIGEKYRSEYATAAVLQASIPMMQGMKGQGNERSIEMWRMMKRWGLDSFDFSDSENPFRVLQCTGAGIPRPWITGISKRPAVMVMALFRDMTYFLHKLKLHSRSRI
jgi:hypothetical protein